MNNRRVLSRLVLEYLYFVECLSHAEIIDAMNTSQEVFRRHIKEFGFESDPRYLIRIEYQKKAQSLLSSQMMSDTMTRLHKDPDFKRRIMDGQPHQCHGFRSSTEYKFANLLNFIGIDYDYELHTFSMETDNRACLYTPDFYLKQFDHYVETKGCRQWWELDKQKCKDFHSQYPQLKYTVLDDYFHILLGDNLDLGIRSHPESKNVLVPEAKVRVQ